MDKYSPAPKAAPELQPQETGLSKSPQEEDDDGTEKSSTTELQKTISEAVAEARALEARLQQNEFAKKLKDHERQMQQAAEDRIEMERRKLKFEQWKLDLEQAKQQQQQQQQQQTVASEDTRTAASEVTTDATETPSSSSLTPSVVVDAVPQTNEPATAVPTDPLLGPVLALLGPKRLHLVSVHVLANLPVWKKQRTYRHDRVKVMAKDKTKSLHLGLPGAICLFEVRVLVPCVCVARSAWGRACNSFYVMIPKN